MPRHPGRRDRPRRGERHRRVRRRVGHLALVFLVACALALGAACGDERAARPPAPAVGGRGLRIAMIAKSTTNPSLIASRLGAEQRARDWSAKLGAPIEI